MKAGELRKEHEIDFNQGGAKLGAERGQFWALIYS
jgi:hypothetical protein